MAGRKLVDPRDESEHRHVELTTDDDEDTLENAPAIDDDESVDVWPNDDSRRPVPPVEESGLSVDPEDLGKQWLNTATEQGNFESTSEPEDDGMHVERLKLPRASPDQG